MASVELEPGIRVLSRRDWLATASASLLMVVAAPRLLRAARASVHSLTVYKDADCSCCDPWVEHLRSSGYRVDVIQEPSYEALQKRKDELRVPLAMRSCHTGVLTLGDPQGSGSYLIEGHVPADAVARLAAERPDVLGLSVPGMPSGTPGMEWSPSAKAAGEYDVLAFGPGDMTRVFGRFPGRRRAPKR
jgi:hypothetical protein